MDLHYLSPLFAPKSIVVFAGPPERQTAYGRSICAQLRDGGYDGALSFLDVSMTGTLADLVQSRADLALIALPHEELAFALEVAGRIQCKSALVVSSSVSPALAAELHAIARKHDLYLLGPNSLGFQRPRLKLNAGVAGKLAQSGSLALISQSGALTSAILDWAGSNSVGLSAVVSLGPNTSVDLAQTLDFLSTDPATESIVIYMEGITDARRFLSALRGTANTKPVVIIKSGNAAASSRAAATHSGMLIGSDEVFDAALRRTGAVRVSNFVQPYLAAGPAIFITYAGQNTFVQPGGQSDTNVSVGAKVDAGATVMLTKRIGAFAQYRFTHFTSKLDFQNTVPAPATETFKTTYDSHHVIVGVSLNF